MQPTMHDMCNCQCICYSHQPLNTDLHPPFTPSNNCRHNYIDRHKIDPSKCRSCHNDPTVGTNCPALFNFSYTLKTQWLNLTRKMSIFNQDYGHGLSNTFLVILTRKSWSISTTTFPGESNQESCVRD